jgi:V/A-type H+-transporting ATPase subunit E
MALHDILEKINQTAQTEIEQINKSFEQKKEDLEKSYASALSQMTEEEQKKAESRINKIKETAKTEGDMEVKNQTLQAKREIIGEIINDAIEKASTADNYEDVLTQLLKKAELSSATVIPAKGKESETKNAIEKSGVKYGLASESKNIKGGFILKSEKVEIDNSFETLIGNELKPLLEIELNKLLFS